MNASIILSVMDKVELLGEEFYIYKIIIAGVLILVGIVWFTIFMYWLFKKRRKKNQKNSPN